MKAFKVFNPDWSCRPGSNVFHFEVGKTYEHTGPVVPCQSGFHACLKLDDCFSYYNFNPDNKVAEVEVENYLTHDDDSKVAAGRITIVRELSWQEVLDLVNTGKNNTGKNNSGNGNSGHGNSGYGNSGDGNSGYWNSGYGNSGDGNSGHGNSGHYNSGNYNSGFFNEDEPNIRLFGKETNLKRHQINVPMANLIFYDSDKKIHYKYKEAWANYWATLNNLEKNKWKSLPNFDAEIFFRITGVRV